MTTLFKQIGNNLGYTKSPAAFTDSFMEVLLTINSGTPRQVKIFPKEFFLELAGGDEDKAEGYLNDLHTDGKLVISGLNVVIELVEDGEEVA